MKPEQRPYRPCVGVLLASRDGRVFLGQRADRTEPAWQMPQGGIDEGETPREAALRELEEETGIPARLVTVEAETADWLSYDFPPGVAETRWGGRFRGQSQKWLLLRFLGEDAEVRLDTDHPEFSAWDWVAPKDVVPRIVPFKRAVYARVLEEFGDLI